MTRVRLRLGLRVRFGDLDCTDPVSQHFGFDRGTPVDRYYIDRFLLAEGESIAGRTLEIGDDSYTARFGASKTTRRDVLHVEDGHPGATYFGDLALPGVLPAATFNCAVVTQTLHLIYDMEAALRELHAALAPGGILLITVPGISQIAGDNWGSSWYWSLTPASLTRLLDDVFGVGNVKVECFGNVFAATAFLQGLAAEELPHAKLDVLDPLYPVIVAGRAVKRENDHLTR